MNQEHLLRVAQRELLRLPSRGVLLVVEPISGRVLVRHDFPREDLLALSGPRPGDPLPADDEALIGIHVDGDCVGDQARVAFIAVRLPPAN